MAEIRPFKGTRYSEQKFPVPPVAPPYDIISENERKRIADEAFNIIHLDKPGSETDEAKYKRAASLLREWKDEGVLLSDEEVSIYAYEQEYTLPEFEDKTKMKRRGFFTTMRLMDYDQEVVLPHEKTLSGPKKDRLSLLKETKTNLSPIFGLYYDSQNLVNEFFESGKFKEPLYNTYFDRDGTKHSFWKVTDPHLIDAIYQVLRDKKVIIADGHHRYETSLQYSKLAREMPEIEGDSADYILICLTNFADDGLVVLPTHRMLTSDISFDALYTKLQDYFDVTEVSKESIKQKVDNLSPKEMVIGFYAGKTHPFYELRLKPGKDYGQYMPSEYSDLWKGLNVNILFYVVFKEILSLEDSAFQRDVTYSHSFQETVSAVEEEEANYAFFLQSIDKFKVKEISEKGELMPQKSTYFYPKLFTGFVMYEHTV